MKIFSSENEHANKKMNMDYSSNSIVNSVLSSSPTHVNVKDVQRPVIAWSCAVKGKVWRSECGMVIENNSSCTHNIPVRLFFAFKTQADYDAGIVMLEGKSLGALKLAVEGM